MTKEIQGIIYTLLKDKPRHGYEIIRELENQFSGFYSPSPGAVYPTLQYLEEMEFVTSQTQDGEKIFTITETGLAFLSGKEKETAEIKAQMKKWWGCFGAEKMPQVKQVLTDAAKEIDRIFKP